MKIAIKRVHLQPGYTVGEITVDGDKMGFTLEDEVREQPGQPVKFWKVAGKTAIPSGKYRVHISLSTRFRRLLPLLLEVPGFAGVRIHAGNSSVDTEGCILVGAMWGGGDWISQSRVAFDAIYTKIYAAWRRGEPITLEIA